MAHILLVDDEPSVLMILSIILTRAGHQTTTVCRGDAAIEQLGETSFDLVVSDMRMSPVNGMEVLAVARRLRPDMPVIMLTAYSCEKTKQEVKELGVYAYLRKPFETDELLDTVSGALKEIHSGDS